jgi:hypothetical protein
MRYKQILQIVFFASLLFACRKQHTTNPPAPPPQGPVKKVLLKDITIPNVPSPFYHFEYNTDSMVTKADFSSGFTMYDVLYSGNKIMEMRNNIFVNHDTLRYSYVDDQISMITFINDANEIYRHAAFTYDGNQVKQIEWDRKVGAAGFLIDRRLTFTYYPDGNVKTIVENRPSINGSAELNSTRLFEQYDDKVNVDDFSLIHDGIHDHLFLLQGFRLQKNNPRKETYLGGVGLISYTVDYTYSYNSDNTPSIKTGDLLFTVGADAGHRFQTHTAYTYY